MVEEEVGKKKRMKGVKNEMGRRVEGRTGGGRDEPGGGKIEGGRGGGRDERRGGEEKKVEEEIERERIGGRGERAGGKSINGVKGWKRGWGKSTVWKRRWGKKRLRRRQG